MAPIQHQKAYGAALIAGSVGMLAVAAFHPTGHQVMGSAETLERFAAINAVVHAVAIGSTTLALLGFTGLARRIGLERADAAAGLIAFALAAVGVVLAASASGFVAPAIAKAMFAADPAARPALRPLLVLNGALNQAFAAVHWMASAAAILFFAVAMLRTGTFTRALAWAGIAVALLTAAALLTGLLRTDLRGLVVLVVAQGAWTVAAGVAMLQAPGEGV